jgi:hypothetical protein
MCADGVTGMPSKPGPGQVGPPAAADMLALDENGNPILPDDTGADGEPVEGVPVEGATPEVAIDAASAPVEAPQAGEPTPQDAIAVVRDYYAAINARNFDRAYALWSDAGPRQRPVAAAIRRRLRQYQWCVGRDHGTQSRGCCRRIALHRGAGGLCRHRQDGRERRFVGAYTLRRAVVDGATADQRAWRIASADLREVMQ